MTAVASVTEQKGDALPCVGERWLRQGRAGRVPRNRAVRGNVTVNHGWVSTHCLLFLTQDAFRKSTQLSAQCSRCPQYTALS